MLFFGLGFSAGGDGGGLSIRSRTSGCGLTSVSSVSAAGLGFAAGFFAGAGLVTSAVGLAGLAASGAGAGAAWGAGAACGGGTLWVLTARPYKRHFPCTGW
jgi:hypothetical protein